MTMNPSIILSTTSTTLLATGIAIAGLLVAASGTLGCSAADDDASNDSANAFSNEEEEKLEVHRFDITPSTICAGEKTTISWDTNLDMVLKADPFIDGISAPSKKGSYTFPLTRSTRFEIKVASLLDSDEWGISKRDNVAVIQKNRTTSHFLIGGRLHCEEDPKDGKPYAVTRETISYASDSIYAYRLLTTSDQDIHVSKDGKEIVTTAGDHRGEWEWISYNDKKKQIEEARAAGIYDEEAAKDKEEEYYFGRKFQVPLNGEWTLRSPLLEAKSCDDKRLVDRDMRNILGLEGSIDPAPSRLQLMVSVRCD